MEAQKSHSSKSRIGYLRHGVGGVGGDQNENSQGI
jgi:hypothetical protein